MSALNNFLDSLLHLAFMCPAIFDSMFLPTYDPVFYEGYLL